MHHNQSHFIQHTDRNHVWINIRTLMFIALIPFSSSLVNKFPADSLAEIFLAANMFIVGALNYWNWAYATRDHKLVSESVRPSFISAEKKRLLIFPIVSMLAILVALMHPSISLYILRIAPVLMFFIKDKGKR